ncbi:9269_t:CDS:1, partial [Gigaspora rosea]
REQRRWREFFSKNNITGDDLSRKLTSLQLLIDEGETNKRKVDDLKANLYTSENTIKRLINEKEEYVKRCNDLEDQNKNLIRNKNALEIEINDLKQTIEEMQVDVERIDRLHKQAIERIISRNE